MCPHGWPMCQGPSCSHADCTIPTCFFFSFFLQGTANIAHHSTIHRGSGRDTVVEKISRDGRRGKKERCRDQTGRDSMYFRMESPFQFLGRIDMSTDKETKRQRDNGIKGQTGTGLDQRHTVDRNVTLQGREGRRKNQRQCGGCRRPV